MTDEELKIWFVNKFNSCYKVSISDFKGVTFYFYDKSYSRRKKLSILNNETVVLPESVTGVCLFEINSNYLNINYDEIIQVFKNHYGDKSDIFCDDILNKVNELLSDITEFSSLSYSIEVSSVEFFSNYIKNRNKITIFE